MPFRQGLFLFQDILQLLHIPPNQKYRGQPPIFQSLIDAPSAYHVSHIRVSLRFRVSGGLEGKLAELLQFSESARLI